MVIPINVSIDDPVWIYVLVTSACMYFLGRAMRSEIHSGTVKNNELVTSILLKIASVFIALSKLLGLLSICMAVFDLSKK